MRRLSPPSRLAFLGFVWLALFALLFPVGDALGLWPAPPQGGFAGSDFVAGLLFSVALLVTLAENRKPCRSQAR